MTEPRHEPAPETGQASGPPAQDDALLSGSVEPSDDTPTIISRIPPRPATTEEVFAGGVRGRRLAHFELIEPIGVGGMAAVLRARDTQLDRCVALKILPPDMALDPENVRRFHQEARAAAKLDHENIARVFFCGEDQRLHFIAFEFVEGENLRAILERRGRLPGGEAVHYMLQVAAGLAHAARRGVVHRDVKPSNIIITPNGRAKLVDMGLARHQGQPAEDGLTQSGVTLGTFDYISPEQALDPRDADVRSDIYSLGCTFYHMLTGRPPVPEGTAAKKLHHHQHVKPADPRQLVAGLPDDVAIILDRMMAKQPKDRYQSPEQLVHHLLLAAHKMGSAPEVPEGVLTVEAALPTPPGGRPLLLLALACAAVVALIFFVDRSSTPPPGLAGGRSAVTGDDPKDKPPVAEADKKDQPPGLPPPSHHPTPGPAIYSEAKPTAAGLKQFLSAQAKAEEVIIELAGDLDLAAVGEADWPDLVFHNKNVRIRARSGSHPTVRYGYDSKPSATTRAPFILDSSHSTIEGIRFIINARRTTDPMAALVYRRGEHVVKGCEFLQEGAPDEKNRLASVVVESPESAPQVLFQQCVFVGAGRLERQYPPRGEEWVLAPNTLGGQNAVTRRGRANLRFENCAFGPHEAICRLEGGVEEDKVALAHCSVLAAGQSAVFDLGDGARAHLEVTGSLFSRPGEGGMGVMGEARGALMVRQSASLGNVAFTGLNNRYHNLDGYWYVAESGMKPTWKDWLVRTSDKDSQELLERPWQDSDPLRQVEQLRFTDAFRASTRLAALRLPDRHLIGVEQLASLSYVDSLPPLGGSPPPAPATTRTLVINPERTTSDPAHGIYARLDEALAVLRPGDMVLIECNGEIKLDPVVLSRKELGDVTLKPQRGCHPVLTLKDTAAGETDTALFRVYDGVLKIEGLEFLLRPGRDEVDAQALVALAGDGRVVLKNCVITLDRAGRTARLAVATLPERGKVMASMEMSPERMRDQGPLLTLQNCFVRGEGTMLSARGGRPGELDLENSLVALTGSLLDVDCLRESPAASGVLLARLNQVTTYLQGNLLRLRAGKDLRSLTPLQVKPSNCLFLPAPPTADRVLVHLEGPEGDEAMLRDKITWGEEGNSNAYGGFSCWLDHQSAEEGKMPEPFDRSRWKTFSKESTIATGRLAQAPAADVPFTQMLPPQFRPAEEAVSQVYGVLDFKDIPLPRVTSP
jgi:serine/threonine protein kinase